MNPPWTAEALRELRDRCGVADIEFHAEIGSTNDRGLQLLREQDLQEPTLILAQTQTAGRGRGVHRWWSGPGALTFSLLIVPEPRSSRDPAHATLRAGVGIARAIESQLGPSGSRVRLKWPNDVLIDERKVCGILVETVGHREAIVVGCGVNVNQSLDEAPEDIRIRATSLYEIDAQTRDLTDTLASIVRHLVTELQPLANRATSENWKTAFRQRCHLTGRLIEIRQGTRLQVGRCLGIDDSGRLLLQTEQGIEAFVSGSIERSDLG